MIKSVKKTITAISDKFESVMQDEKRRRIFKLMTIVSLVLCVLCMILAFVLGVFVDTSNVKIFALGAMVFCLPLVFYSFFSHKQAKAQVKASREVPLAKVTGKLIRKSEEVYGLRNIREPEMHELPDYKSREYRQKTRKKSPSTENRKNEDS